MELQAVSRVVCHVLRGGRSIFRGSKMEVADIGSFYQPCIRHRLAFRAAFIILILPNVPNTPLLFLGWAECYT